MALSADRIVNHRQSIPVEYGYMVQAGAHVYRGSIVALCSDYTLIPAGSVGAPVAVAIVGIAARQQIGGPPPVGAVQSSLNSQTAVKCRKGSFQLPFDAPPPASAIGTPVYAIDDQTVSLSNGASGGGAATHLQVGVLEGFDERGNPWTKI